MKILGCSPEDKYFSGQHARWQCEAIFFILFVASSSRVLGNLDSIAPAIFFSISELLTNYHFYDLPFPV